MRATESTSAEVRQVETALPDLIVNDRQGNGLKIALWMRQNTTPTELYVTVEDDRNGRFDRLEVPSPDLAKHYYEHPMAYLGSTALEDVITGNHAA